MIQYRSPQEWRGIPILAVAVGLVAIGPVSVGLVAGVVVSALHAVGVATA